MAALPDSKSDPNETDPCCSLLVSEVPNKPALRHFPWGLISSIPLFVYGAIPLLFGAGGLIFVPAILMGGVSIGGHTTLVKVFGWILFHLAMTAHGCAILLAAIRFYGKQWRRGVYTIAVGMILPGIIFVAFYLAYIVFGAAN